ncbi:MAG: DUF86 domain-containing protein [Actinobacteria bacterium]|nr:DUF86 domain-containing protein [Actinomycetota bacterium]
MKDDAGNLADILEAIDEVLARSPSYDDLVSDRNLEIWVLHHLRVVGEAMTRLSDDLRRANPEVPWRQVIGMRHVIVHGYDRVRLDIVASVIGRNLSPLRDQIAAIRQELE